MILILAVHLTVCLSLKGGTAANGYFIEKEGNAQRKRERRREGGRCAVPSVPSLRPLLGIGDFFATGWPLGDSFHVHDAYRWQKDSLSFLSGFSITYACIKGARVFTVLVRIEIAVVLERDREQSRVVVSSLVDYRFCNYPTVTSSSPRRKRRPLLVLSGAKR